MLFKILIHQSVCFSVCNLQKGKSRKVFDIVSENVLFHFDFGGYSALWAREFAQIVSKNIKFRTFTLNLFICIVDVNKVGNMLRHSTETPSYTRCCRNSIIFRILNVLCKLTYPACKAHAPY